MAGQSEILTRELATEEALDDLGRNADLFIDMYTYYVLLVLYIIIIIHFFIKLKAIFNSNSGRLR